MRSAIACNAVAAEEPGSDSTTGVPASPPSDTAASIGTDPTSGAPVSAASLLPPPDPKMGCRVPSGATNSLMFSTTPSTFRYDRRAMSATRDATFCAPMAGVVTTSISAWGKRRASAIWMSPVPGGMSMSR